jgi:hypothetical protein
MQFVLKTSPPNVYIGVQPESRLDSRLTHAGVTDFGWPIALSEQAAEFLPIILPVRLGDAIISHMGKTRDENTDDEENNQRAACRCQLGADQRR